MIGFPIAEDLAALQAQLAEMAEKGFHFKEDDLILENIKNGAQDLINKTSEGEYDRVNWQDGILDVRNVRGEQLGLIQPNGVDFITNFREDAAGLWDYLTDQINHIFGK